MNKSVVYKEGIVGITVSINHPEMIILKGLAERAEKMAAMLSEHDAVSIGTGENISLLTDTANFINNFLPEDILSLEGAYESLFKRG
jgi:hypothetical protein